MIELIILSTLGLWLAFAVVFPVASWAKRQPKWVQIPIYPLVFAFLLLDVLYNAVIGSIVFLQPPSGRKYRWIETFSERIEEIRDYESKRSWRYKLAGVFERIILSVDPNHF